jgi:hypothetical protein
VKRFPGPFDNLPCDIRAGMANLFWWSAWADRQDELREEGLESANLVATEISQVADDPTEQQRIEVKAHVAKVAKAIEKANHAKLPTLYKRAIKANHDAAKKDGTPYIPGPRASEDQFGSTLAHSSMGSGVSWFDDNEKFDLKMPYFEWGPCYMSWPGPTTEEAIDAYVERVEDPKLDAQDKLELLVEFLDSKNLGSDLHEFLIARTGGR